VVSYPVNKKIACHIDIDRPAVAVAQTPPLKFPENTRENAGLAHSPVPSERITGNAK
jgi:hypothetical protein